jgi:hypothetical protein
MYVYTFLLRKYSLHQNIQSPNLSLIDGDANGGLSVSDVVALSKTFHGSGLL